MKENLSSQEQLIRNIESLRQRIGELEKSDAKHKDEESSLNKARNELEEQLVRRSVELARTNVDLQDEIKERKRAQAEIEGLKKQMEFILGATKTGLDIIDSDCNIVYIDAEWQKVYGDPKGKKCYQYFMGRNRVCPGCGVTKALETKKPIVTEEILAKEGNRPIQVTTIPFQDEKGNWLVAEVNVDVTERKKAEEKIKIFSDAVASAFDCFLLTDTKGNITYTNASACATFGYTLEEFLKLNIADLDVDPKVAKKVMQEMLAKGKWSGEVTNIRKDKKKFASLLSAFIIKDELGSPKGTMGILRDITKRKG
jgi:PAS domain S-box-containing protein